VLLGAAACGTDTVAETDPGAQQAGVEARIYPPVSVPPMPISKPSPMGTSADAAERRAAADKARAERADALRAAQGQQIQNKLDQAGKPDRP
jgi:hypothetical protein